jgi:hypothetical protein
MTEILLSSEDLTVFGGPSSLNIEVDFGPTGNRGSNIFVGNGNPNSVQTVDENNAITIDGQSIQVFDMYINRLPSDSEYLSLYQYHNVNGTNAWDPVVSLKTNTYAGNGQSTFSDGSTTVLVGLALIDPLAVGLDASHFNVQHSIINNIYPVSSSCSVGAVTSASGILSLPITIKAVEYDGTAWSNLSGSKMVHLLINVV